MQTGGRDYDEKYSFGQFNENTELKPEVVSLGGTDFTRVGNFVYFNKNNTPPKYIIIAKTHIPNKFFKTVALTCMLTPSSKLLYI